ncbi:uncharacterized protein LOC101852261 [Aplysia californica]|uniref:Uncharacterized protein LOC101852261 n=1 Tax=Aplysia californica TaxID=6500 RepID=A0ABM1A7C2_APLCA|nr:uncharacterized protein LOC101852261 [Aplysia californica]
MRPHHHRYNQSGFDAEDGQMRPKHLRGFVAESRQMRPPHKGFEGEHGRMRPTHHFVPHKGFEAEDGQMRPSHKGFEAEDGQMRPPHLPHRGYEAEDGYPLAGQHEPPQPIEAADGSLWIRIPRAPRSCPLSSPAVRRAMTSASPDVTSPIRQHFQQHLRMSSPAPGNIFPNFRANNNNYTEPESEEETIQVIKLQAPPKRRGKRLMSDSDSQSSASASASSSVSSTPSKDASILIGQSQDPPGTPGKTGRAAFGSPVKNSRLNILGDFSASLEDSNRSPKRLKSDFGPLPSPVRFSRLASEPRGHERSMTAQQDKSSPKEILSKRVGCGSSTAATAAVSATATATLFPGTLHAEGISSRPGFNLPIDSGPRPFQTPPPPPLSNIADRSSELSTRSPRPILTPTRTPSSPRPTLTPTRQPPEPSRYPTTPTQPKSGDPLPININSQLPKTPASAPIFNPHNQRHHLSPPPCGASGDVINSYDVVGKPLNSTSSTRGIRIDEREEGLPDDSSTVETAINDAPLSHNISDTEVRSQNSASEEGTKRKETDVRAVEKPASSIVTSSDATTTNSMTSSDTINNVTSQDTPKVLRIRRKKQEPTVFVFPDVTTPPEQRKDEVDGFETQMDMDVGGDSWVGWTPQFGSHAPSSSFSSSSSSPFHHQGQHLGKNSASLSTPTRGFHGFSGHQQDQQSFHQSFQQSSEQSFPPSVSLSRNTHASQRVPPRNHVTSQEGDLTYDSQRRFIWEGEESTHMLQARNRFNFDLQSDLHKSGKQNVLYSRGEQSGADNRGVLSRPEEVLDTSEPENVVHILEAGSEGGSDDGGVGLHEFLSGERGSIERVGEYSGGVLRHNAAEESYIVRTRADTNVSCVISLSELSGSSMSCEDEGHDDDDDDDYNSDDNDDCVPSFSRSRARRPWDETDGDGGGNPEAGGEKITQKMIVEGQLRAQPEALASDVKTSVENDVSKTCASKRDEVIFVFPDTPGGSGEEGETTSLTERLRVGEKSGTESAQSLSFKKPHSNITSSDEHCQNSQKYPKNESQILTDPNVIFSGQQREVMSPKPRSEHIRGEHVLIDCQNNGGPGFDSGLQPRLVLSNKNSSDHRGAGVSHGYDMCNSSGESTGFVSQRGFEPRTSGQNRNTNAAKYHHNTQIQLMMGGPCGSDDDYNDTDEVDGLGDDEGDNGNTPTSSTSSSSSSSSATSSVAIADIDDSSVVHILDNPARAGTTIKPLKHQPAQRVVQQNDDSIVSIFSESPLADKLTQAQQVQHVQQNEDSVVSIFSQTPLVESKKSPTLATVSVTHPHEIHELPKPDSSDIVSIFTEDSSKVSRQHDVTRQRSDLRVSQISEDSKDISIVKNLSQRLTKSSSSENALRDSVDSENPHHSSSFMASSHGTHKTRAGNKEGRIETETFRRRGSLQPPTPTKPIHRTCSDNTLLLADGAFFKPDQKSCTWPLDRHQRRVGLTNSPSRRKRLEHPTVYSRSLYTDGYRLSPKPSETDMRRNVQGCYFPTTPEDRRVHFYLGDSASPDGGASDRGQFVSPVRGDRFGRGGSVSPLSFGTTASQRFSQSCRSWEMGPSEWEMGPLGRGKGPSEAEKDILAWEKGPSANQAPPTPTRLSPSAFSNKDSLRVTSPRSQLPVQVSVTSKSPTITSLRPATSHSIVKDTLTRIQHTLADTSTEQAPPSPGLTRNKTSAVTSSREDRVMTSPKKKSRLKFHRPWVSPTKDEEHVTSGDQSGCPEAGEFAEKTEDLGENITSDPGQTSRERNRQQKEEDGDENDNTGEGKEEEESEEENLRRQQLYHHAQRSRSLIETSPSKSGPHRRTAPRSISEPRWNKRHSDGDWALRFLEQTTIPELTSSSTPSPLRSRESLMTPSVSGSCRSEEFRSASRRGGLRQRDVVLTPSDQGQPGTTAGRSPVASAPRQTPDSGSVRREEPTCECARIERQILTSAVDMFRWVVIVIVIIESVVVIVIVIVRVMVIVIVIVIVSVSVSVIGIVPG